MCVCRGACLFVPVLVGGTTSHPPARARVRAIARVCRDEGGLSWDALCERTMERMKLAPAQAQERLADARVLYEERMADVKARARAARETAAAKRASTAATAAVASAPAEPVAAATVAPAPVQEK